MVRADNFDWRLRGLVFLGIFISISVKLTSPPQECFVVTPHPRSRSVIRTTVASVTTQVIVWSLAENAMNWTANPNLLDRPVVGLGVSKALTAVNLLCFRNKFGVRHRTSLSVGSKSAARTSSPSQVIGRHLLERTMFAANDGDWSVAVHIVVHVRIAVPMNSLGVLFEIRESLSEMRPQDFRATRGAAASIQVRIWTLQKRSMLRTYDHYLVYSPSVAALSIVIFPAVDLPCLRNEQLGGTLALLFGSTSNAAISAPALTDVTASLLPKPPVNRTNDADLRVRVRVLHF